MSGERDPLWMARSMLRIADKAGMPDKYWETDRVIAEAREKLGVPVDGRQTHAHLWTQKPVTDVTSALSTDPGESPA